MCLDQTRDLTTATTLHSALLAVAAAHTHWHHAGHIASTPRPVTIRHPPHEATQLSTSTADNELIDTD
ncbi:hypothetical protein E2C01_064141 [Portunus trituberculatus]|uniref:Uncharacterized protein n=1 Tax=Portunus trituberculatus TaxID=210409 RepID=A0A5B7HMG8_PORTR|nr:hypothetical protein [Portunus trituberculatus]